MQQLIGTEKMLTTKGEKREGIVPQGGKRAPEVIRLQEEVGLVRWTKGRGHIGEWKNGEWKMKTPRVA